MIAPYTRFTIKGVLWYQGETDSDAKRAPYYARVFPALISDWRRQWGEGDFPFLFVQISSFNSHRRRLAVGPRRPATHPLFAPHRHGGHAGCGDPRKCAST